MYKFHYSERDKKIYWDGVVDHFWTKVPFDSLAHQSPAQQASVEGHYGHYSFEFDPALHTVFFEGRDSGNSWKKQSSHLGYNENYAKIAGYIADLVKFEVNGKRISGKWLNCGRPNMTGRFLSPNSGFATFPDDRRYGNKWNKRVEIPNVARLDEASIEGNYGHAVYVDDGKISGEWINCGRPKFEGEVNGTVGFVSFSDDRKYSFEFDVALQAIFFLG